MKLNTIIKQLYVPMGLTSFMNCLSTGNFDSVKTPKIENYDIAQIETELDKLRDKQATCNSDPAWWGYESSIGYIECILRLMKAAQITGVDNLPDIPLPYMEGCCIMDSISLLHHFGKDMLTAAQLAPKPPLNYQI